MMTLQRERDRKTGTHQKIKYPLSICGREKAINMPRGDVDWVQHYASVDERKCLHLGVTGDLFIVWTGLNSAGSCHMLPLM